MSRRWAFFHIKGSSLSGELSNLRQGSRRTQYEGVDDLIQPEATAEGTSAAIGSAEGKDEDEDRWSCMLSELLAEIIKRVEASEDQWPLRKSVVACACVCRKWREVTTSIVRSPQESGMITFPSSLKQVVLVVAADCNPKWLTKHVPALASSRKVPVILERDGKGGSLRLGGLLNIKTALAIGVKAIGSSINAAFEEII